MHDLDAVVTLSSLLLPCRIDDPAAIAKTYDQQCRLVFNVTGTPAISVPTGHTAAGVPLAMQIAGRAFAEPMVYRIAQAYCAATGFADKRPPIKLRTRIADASPAERHARRVRRSISLETSLRCAPRMRSEKAESERTA